MLGPDVHKGRCSDFLVSKMDETGYYVDKANIFLVTVTSWKKKSVLAVKWQYGIFERPRQLIMKFGVFLTD